MNWVTQSGASITIKDMDTSHLVNSIRRVLRNNWRQGLLQALLAELTRRGLADVYPEFYL